MDTNHNSEHKEDKIELIDLFKKINAQRKTIYVSLIVAFILGIIIVILTPRQYKTELSLLAESSSSSPASGLLGQLGGLSGMNVGSLLGLDINGSMGNDVLTPDLYPDIVKSTTFLIEILNSKIEEPRSKENITVAQYLDAYTKPSIAGLPGYFINLFMSKTEMELIKTNEGKPLELTKKQTNIIKALSSLIEVNIIKSGGGLTGGESKIINVVVEAQNPFVSASLADLVVKNLKQYIINYNTGKAKKDLEFIEARYYEAQDKYYKTQKALADFDDSNINVILASVRTERKRIETENNLASNLYKGLAETLEQAKIKVQDRTPVFTVIEPAKIPLKKSKPKTSLIIIGMLLIGLFVGVTIILKEEFIISRQSKNL